MSWFNILKNRGFDNRVVKIFKRMEDKDVISTKRVHWTNLMDRDEWIEMLRTYGRDNVKDMMGLERFNRTSKKIMRGDKSTHNYDRFLTHITLLECYVEQDRFYVRYELKGLKDPQIVLQEGAYTPVDITSDKVKLRRKPFSSVGGNKAVIEISFDHNETPEELINMDSRELSRRFEKLRGGTIAAGRSTQRLGGSIKIKSGEGFVATLGHADTKTSMGGGYSPLQLIYTRTINAYYRSVEEAVREIQTERATRKVLERRKGGTPSSDALREED